MPVQRVIKLTITKPASPGTCRFTREDTTFIVNSVNLVSVIEEIINCTWINMRVFSINVKFVQSPSR